MIIKTEHATMILLFLLVVSTPVLSLPVRTPRTRRSQPQARELLGYLWRLQSSITMLNEGAIEAYTHLCAYDSIMCNAGGQSEHFERPSIDIQITLPSNHPSARQAVEDYYKQLYPIIDRYSDSVLTIRSLEQRDRCTDDIECIQCHPDRKQERGINSFYCSITHELGGSVEYTKRTITSFLNSRGYSTNSTVNLGEMAFSTVSKKMEFKADVIKSLIEDSRAIHEEIWKLFTLVRDIMNRHKHKKDRL